MLRGTDRHGQALKPATPLQVLPQQVLPQQVLKADENSHTDMCLEHHQGHRYMDKQLRCPRLMMEAVRQHACRMRPPEGRCPGCGGCCTLSNTQKHEAHEATLAKLSGGQPPARVNHLNARDDLSADSEQLALPQEVQATDLHQRFLLLLAQAHGVYNAQPGSSGQLGRRQQGGGEIVVGDGLPHGIRVQTGLGTEYQGSLGHEVSHLHACWAVWIPICLQKQTCQLLDVNLRVR